MHGAFEGRPFFIRQKGAPIPVPGLNRVGAQSFETPKAVSLLC